jgi:hypothetical protein
MPPIPGIAGLLSPGVPIVRQSQKKHPYNCRPSRSSRGQALVEGVVALALIVAGTVGAALLLTNVGLSLFFKEKLAFCNNQASQYAFAIRSTANLEEQTTTFVRELLPRLGVAPNQLSVDVDPNVTIAGRPAVSVTIRNTCSLVGSGSIIPVQLALTDSSTATTSGSGGTSSSASAFLEIPSLSASQTPVLVPIAGKPPANYDAFKREKTVFQLRKIGFDAQNYVFGEPNILPELSP